MPRSALLAAAFLLTACGSEHIIAFGVESDDDDDGGGGWDAGTDTGGSDGGNGDGDNGDGGDGGNSDGGNSDGASAELSIEAGELVITEVMIDATAVSDELGEWVELYNASDRDLDIDGLVLGDDGVDAWPLDVSMTLSPGQYGVLCADPASASNGGVSCDGSFHYNTWGEGFALSNGGDEVALWRDDGLVIDDMAYSEGQVLPGYALGLAPGRIDAGDNDSGGAWCLQSSTLSGGDHGTPGQANDGC